MRRVERRVHVEPRPRRGDCQTEIPWMRGLFTVLLVKLYYDHLISPGIHQDVVFYSSTLRVWVILSKCCAFSQKYKPEITKSFSNLAVTPNHSPWKGFFDILRAELGSPLRNPSTVVRRCSKRLKRKAMCLEVAAHESYHSGAEHFPTSHFTSTFSSSMTCMKHSACGAADPVLGHFTRDIQRDSRSAS